MNFESWWEQEKRIVGGFVGGRQIAELAWNAATKAALEWQPIETAPISTSLERQWFWGYAPEAPYGYGPDDRQHLCVRYKWACKVHGSSNDRRVTHWMPLPEPPLTANP